MLQTIDLSTRTIYFYYFINQFSQQGKTKLKQGETKKKNINVQHTYIAHN